MGVKFGEIDVGQIIENEYRIGVLEKLLEWVMNNNSGLNKPDPLMLQDMRAQVLGQLQRKYPNSGISQKWNMSEKFNITSSDRLVHATVQQRREHYFLVTQEMLGGLKSSSYLADLFTVLASILWGAFFSNIIAEASVSNVPDQALRDLTTYRIVFLVTAILFSALAGVFLVLRYKKMASITSFDVAVSTGDVPKVVRQWVTCPSGKKGVHCVVATFFFRKEEAASHLSSDCLPTKEICLARLDQTSTVTVMTEEKVVARSMPQVTANEGSPLSEPALEGASALSPAGVAIQVAAGIVSRLGMPPAVTFASPEAHAEMVGVYAGRILKGMRRVMRHTSPADGGGGCRGEGPGAGTFCAVRDGTTTGDRGGK
jgi:hypothetical protein